MKLSLIILVHLVILINVECSSQQYKTGIYDRIDSIVTLDMETNITDTQIVNYTDVFIDADNCESLPQHFIAKPCVTNKVRVKKLTALEFRCNGMFQREWEGEWTIHAFSIKSMSKKQTNQATINQGPEFSPDAKEIVSKLKSGDQLVFENILLEHPIKGKVTAEFIMEVK